MALVPHKITALAESDADGTDGKNIIAGAVVSLFDINGDAVILYDDENGANGSTTKQTDANGVVVVYVEEGEYDEQANNGIKRRVLIGSKSNNIVSYATTAEIESLRPQRTGSRIENRERANAQYVLAAAGYVAQAGDITAANGRVWALSDGQALTPEKFGASTDPLIDSTQAVKDWASSAGSVSARGRYLISEQIDVYSQQVDAMGAVFTFSPTAQKEQAMFRFMADGVMWSGGELDGNLIASEGFITFLGGHTIQNSTIHSLRAEVGRCVGVRLEGQHGSNIINNHIYDLFAQGDGNPGNSNGACRAILATHDMALISPHVIDSNTIHDIWGEEGDGIQLLYFDGVLPMLSAANSVLSRNRVYGCGRRALKCQASDVFIDNNDLRLLGGSAPASQAGIATIVTMNILDGEMCTVTNNKIESASDSLALSVVMASSYGKAEGNVIDSNTIICISDSDSVFIDRQKFFSFSNNLLRGGRRGLALGSSTMGDISGNKFVSSNTSGTFSDLEANSTNSMLSIKRNISLGGEKFRFINTSAPLSTVCNNDILRETGDGVFVGGNTNSLVSDTFSTSSGNCVSVSTDSARISNSVNLGAGSSGFGGAILWSNGIPSVVRATKKHNIGDVAFSTTGGAAVGWICTESGTPGTWVQF